MLDIGITSNAYEDKSKYKINFKKIVKDGYNALDYQGVIAYESAAFSMSEEELTKYYNGLYLKMKENNLYFSQLHLFWAPYKENEVRDHLIFYYERGLEVARLLHAPYAVVHPISPGVWWKENFSDEEYFNLNMDFLAKVADIAKEKGVGLAIENLPFLENEFFSVQGTIKLIDALNKDNVFMCLDTGHQNMWKRDLYEDIIQIGDRLKVLHIHDNNTHADSHNFPFMGRVKWDKFEKGLKDIGFNGVLSLETSAPKLENKQAQRYLEKSLALIIKDIRNAI